MDQPTAGKSRFSQWFRTDAPSDSQSSDSAPLSVMQKLRGPNEVEPDKLMPSQFSPNSNPPEMSNERSSFLEMLQRGKITNMGW